MRRVTITNLYRNLSAELSDLPFEITKDGKDVAVVLVPSSKSLESVKSLESENSFKRTLKDRIRLAREIYNPQPKASQKGDK